MIISSRKVTTQASKRANRTKVERTTKEARVTRRASKHKRKRRRITTRL